MLNTNFSSSIVTDFAPQGSVCEKASFQVTLSTGDEWWGKLENVFEVAIEVRTHWRGMLRCFRESKTLLCDEIVR